jgi:hypothetical protein
MSGPASVLAGRFSIVPNCIQIFDGGSAELFSWTGKSLLSWENTGNFCPVGCFVAK